MSHNTFNLFNFFQQPNTGKIPPPGAFQKDEVLNGSRLRPNKGRIADFNWNFPYLERAIPLQIFEKSSSEGLFQILLFSDSYSNSPQGIRFPYFSISLYGNFLKDINEEYLKLELSGVFFPHDRDFDLSKINLSGIFKEDPKQENILRNKISGFFSGSLKENNYVNQIISGSFIDLRADNNLSQLNISGVLEKNYYDESLNKILLSGNFFPITKDFFNIDYNITGFSSFKGVDILNKNFDDIFNLNYNITGYTSEEGI